LGCLTAGLIECYTGALTQNGAICLLAPLFGGNDRRSGKTIVCVDTTLKSTA